MRILMISGDRSMFIPGTPANERLLLQRAQVDELNAIVWGKRSLFSTLAIINMARNGHFDVITAQDPFWRGLVAWIAARFSGARLQLQVHTDLMSPEFARGFSDTLRLMLAKFLLRRADSIRVVSTRVAQSLTSLNIKGTVSVLPIYVDLDEVRSAAPIALRSMYPQFTHIILIVSRLEREKNVEGALYVLQKVLRDVPGAGLLIAGDGSRRESLESLAGVLGVDAHVIFLGHRNDIFSLYKGVDVLLVTSYYEGFGASIIEALSVGCPVVSPDVGIAKEAGAVVVGRDQLASAVTDVLTQKPSVQLQLPTLDSSAWANAWKASLPQ